MVSTRHMLTNNNPTESSSTVAIIANAYGSKQGECGIPNENTPSGVQEDLLSTTVINGNVGETSAIQLLDLPEELLTNILSYVSYNEIAQLRIVSRKMNTVCMRILNSAFSKLLTKTYDRVQSIKANMPRRESARRKHPFAFECDIIETCYLRLSMMQVKFKDHMERGHCCFFPGAILDEVYAVMKYVRNTSRLENPFYVTNELFDLSAMAIDYFRDYIKPTLPSITCFEDFFELPTISTPKSNVSIVDFDNSSRLSPGKLVLGNNMYNFKKEMKAYKKELSGLRNALQICKRKSLEQYKLYTEQRKLFAEQTKQTLRLENRLDECDKKNEEMSRKLSTLLEELNKYKTELQYWRCVKSPPVRRCKSCGKKMAPWEGDYQALSNQGGKLEDNTNESPNDNKLSTNENAGITDNSKGSSSANVDSKKDEFTTKQLKRSYSTTVSLPSATNNGETSIDHNGTVSDLTTATTSAVAFAEDFASNETKKSRRL